MNDLISRQAVIDEIKERISANGFGNVGLISELNRLEGYILQLPSAQPEKCEDCGNFDKTRLLIPQPDRKVGKWIYHPEIKNIYGGKCIECSECGEKYMVVYIEDEKYCRNCGSYNGAKTEG